MGLHQLIKMSKIGQTFQSNILCAAMRFWVPSVNSFVFPFGLASITLRNVFLLIGLLVIGPDAPCLINIEDTNLIKYSAASTDFSSYHSLIQYRVKNTSEPLEKEHVEFF